MTPVSGFYSSEHDLGYVEWKLISSDGYAWLDGGAFWTVPVLLFEKKELIPALQPLLIGQLND